MLRHERHIRGKVGDGVIKTSVPCRQLLDISDQDNTHSTTLTQSSPHLEHHTDTIFTTLPQSLPQSENHTDTILTTLPQSLLPHCHNNYYHHSNHHHTITNTTTTTTTTTLPQSLLPPHCHNHHHQHHTATITTTSTTLPQSPPPAPHCHNHHHHHTATITTTVRAALSLIKSSNTPSQDELQLQHASSLSVFTEAKIHRMHSKKISQAY
ncbi:hypothetical protein FHG87_021260 [Trinorchestia longiramus]|nr:hypothetical protein FHG87_021260 [Trinorchestia longiramus]